MNSLVHQLIASYCILK